MVLSLVLSWPKDADGDWTVILCTLYASYAATLLGDLAVCHMRALARAPDVSGVGSMFLAVARVVHFLLIV